MSSVCWVTVRTKRPMDPLSTEIMGCCVCWVTVGTKKPTDPLSAEIMAFDVCWLSADCSSALSLPLMNTSRCVFSWFQHRSVPDLPESPGLVLHTVILSSSICVATGWQCLCHWNSAGVTCVNNNKWKASSWCQSWHVWYWFVLFHQKLSFHSSLLFCCQPRALVSFSPSLSLFPVSDYYGLSRCRNICSRGVYSVQQLQSVKCPSALFSNVFIIFLDVPVNIFIFKIIPWKLVCRYIYIWPWKYEK